MNYKKKSSTSWLRFQLRFPKVLLTKADFLKLTEQGDFWISIWIWPDMIVLWIILFCSTHQPDHFISQNLLKKKTVSWIKYHHHNLTKAVHCSVDATLQMTRGWLHSCGWSDINFNHGKRGKKNSIPFQKLVAWFEGTSLRLIPLKLTHLLPWHLF